MLRHGLQPASSAVKRRKKRQAKTESGSFPITPQLVRDAEKKGL
jgi:hypothetical protein